MRLMELLTLIPAQRPYFFNVNTDRSASRISEVIDIQTAYDQPEKELCSVEQVWFTKLDLSGLEGFSTEHADDIVNFAEIEIGPIDELITGDTPPVALFLYLTDKRNSLIRDRERFRSIQRKMVLMYWVLPVLRYL